MNPFEALDPAFSRSFCAFVGGHPRSRFVWARGRSRVVTLASRTSALRSDPQEEKEDEENGSKQHQEGQLIAPILRSHFESDTVDHDLATRRKALIFHFPQTWLCCIAMRDRPFGHFPAGTTNGLGFGDGCS
jgi:hypothetical protein